MLQRPPWKDIFQLAKLDGGGGMGRIFFCVKNFYL